MGVKEVEDKKKVIIKDEVKIHQNKVTRNLKSGKKEYIYYFVTLSSEYSKMLKRGDVLRNVEIIANNERLHLDSVKLHQEYYKKKSDGEKVQYLSITIPKEFAERHLNEKLLLIAEAEVS